MEPMPNAVGVQVAHGLEDGLGAKPLPSMNSFLQEVAVRQVECHTMSGVLEPILSSGNIERHDSRHPVNSAVLRHTNEHLRSKRCDALMRKVRVNGAQRLVVSSHVGSEQTHGADDNTVVIGAFLNIRTHLSLQEFYIELLHCSVKPLVHSSDHLFDAEVVLCHNGCMQLGRKANFEVAHTFRVVIHGEFISNPLHILQNV